MRRTRTIRRRAGGFSLLELSLVLVILGLLAASAAIVIGPATARAKKRTTITSMETISSQINIYNAEHSRLPESIESLASQGYLDAQKLQDGWSRDYYYNVTNLPDTPFELISAGPDGDFDTADDINVWTMHLEDEDA